VKTALKSVDFDEVVDENKLESFYLCTLYTLLFACFCSIAFASRESNGTGTVLPCIYSVAII